MARPQKQTVDYFPHDVNASGGKTLFVLQNKYGNDGYAFWFKLLELLGGTPGHVYDFNKPPDWEFLLAKTGVNATLTQEILTTLSNLDAIDSDLFQNNKIIWCQKFVDRLEDVYKRRDEKPQKPVIVNNKPINDNNNLINVNNNTQSKVKETKVNKTKENNSTPETIKTVFYSFKDDGYSDIKDFDNQFKKFCEYWFEGKRKLQNPKLACHNWLDKAREYQNNGGNGHGATQGNANGNGSQDLAGAGYQQGKKQRDYSAWENV